jgi:hypothetical protein
MLNIWYTDEIYVVETSIVFTNNNSVLMFMFLNLIQIQTNGGIGKSLVFTFL